MREILRNKGKIKVLLIVVGVFLLFSLGYILIHIFDDKKKDENNTDEEDAYIVTMQVIDYEDEGATWESRYDITNLSSGLYKDGELINDKGCDDLKRVINFSPESKSVKANFKDSIKHNDETGIIYELDLSESESYIASLLSNGYSLRRKILSSTYAELYLLDTVGNTVRILCLSDKMLFGELKKNTELPDIESYFN